MKKFLARGLFISTIVVLMAVRCGADTNRNSSVADGATGPRIVFDKTAFDLGTLTNVDAITAEFTFQNKGDADLHINVQWGGYSGSLPKFLPVPPGQKGRIPIRLALGTARGKITKHVKIETDDPRNPVIPLTVTVNVSAADKSD